MPTDLQLARSSCNLDVSNISTLLLPNSQRSLRTRINDILSREPLWDLSVRPHLSQTSHLIRSLRLCHRLLQLRETHSWSQEEYREAIRLSDDNLPITLHESAFTSMIYAQGTDSQRNEWIPRCARLEVVGCYAQTELAHGSNVQGLMTTAVYDNSTDEFVIESNGIKGAKWWIGGAGVLANYALVQAILKVKHPEKGKFVGLGPHLFIVPIRDLQNHLPLPRVTVGDQGPKSYGGFASLDNGYIKFDSVRIPRENMLMRFSKLDKTGKYTKASHDKISYGSMVALRAAIPENIGWALGKAVTTAIRYCITRRQFSSPGGNAQEELQVIRYASVKHRLYPLLAQSYAFILSGRNFWSLYALMQDALVTRGDTTMLPEIHSLSTALKVSTTNDATKGMEEARRTMGGHGFSWMSGVGGWWANWTPSQTYEGENYVIAQQTARGLLKHLQKLKTDHTYKLPESSEYLRLIGAKRNFVVPKHNGNGDRDAIREFYLNHENLVSLLEYRAAYLIGQLAYDISSSPQKPWTDYSFKTFSVCRAHAELYIAKTFFSITTSQSPPNTIHTLSQIYALHTLTTSLSDLLESSVLTPSSARDIKLVYDWLIMDSLSVGDVVGLTDAYGFEDWELGVLGCRDGRVYERMWEEVGWREGREERGKRERVAGFNAEEEGGEGKEGGWDRVREEARRVLGFWRDKGKEAKL